MLIETHHYCVVIVSRILINWKLYDVYDVKTHSVYSVKIMAVTLAAFAYKNMDCTRNLHNIERYDINTRNNLVFRQHNILWLANAAVHPRHFVSRVYDRIDSSRKIVMRTKHLVYLVIIQTSYSNSITSNCAYKWTQFIFMQNKSLLNEWLQKMKMLKIDLISLII